jgi:L-glyceraldehyde 3-phosphate reductase
VLEKGVLSDRYLDEMLTGGRLDEMGSRGREVYDELRSSGEIKKVRRLNDLARQRGQSLAQLAVTWVLRDPRVTSVVVGVSSVAQLNENIDAAAAPALTADELDRIERILAD